MSTQLVERLSVLIEQQVTSGQVGLNDLILKDIKKICRTSDNVVGEAYRILRGHLDRDHAEIRWSAFLLIKELFERSHCFRELLVDDIHDYLVLVAETDRRNPLPAPKPAALRLKEHAVRTFKEWHDKFGAAYKKLALAYTFLRETRKIVVPVNAVSVPTARYGRSAVRVIDKRRIDLVKTAIVDNDEELKTLLMEINNLFRILIPDLNGDGADSKTAVSNDNYRHNGLLASTFTLQVDFFPRSFRLQKTEENDAILEKVEENALLLNNRFLPLVVSWLAILSKSGAEEADLKKCIDLKRELEGTLRKAASLGIEFSKPVKRRKPEYISDDDNDDDFEDVPEKEGLELIIPPNKRKEYGLEMISQNMQIIQPPQKPAQGKCDHPLVAISPPASSKGESERAELLARAPVIPFGRDLEDWGKEKPLPAASSFQTQFDALHRFWQPPEIAEDFTNPELAGSLFTRSMPFPGTFEPVKWFCRAPLPSGQLCSRQDRIKCPFHGKIIARDANGMPVNEEERIEEQRAKDKAEEEKVPDWQDPQLLRDIQAATGLDLKVEKRRKRKKGVGNLTDVKAVKNTPRNRLEKKVMSKSAVNRVGAELDELCKQNNAARFAHNWNYIFQA